MWFDGRVAVITGAGSGIGRATAIGYARRGGAVAVLDQDAEAASRVVAEIEASGGQALAVPVDVRRQDDVDGAIKRAARELGRIDLLHNNAYARPERFERRAIGELPLEHWQDTLNVALNAVFWGVRSALPLMVAQGGGAIVNTGSLAGLYGDAGNGAYATAKAAILNLTRVVALEYGPFNIRCNAVTPGVVDTGLSVAGPRREAVLNAVPLGRAGTPEEVANAVLFLASDLAGFITGAAIVVDGGQTAAMPGSYSR